MKTHFTTLCILFFLVSTTARSQEETTEKPKPEINSIEEIVSNPGKYNNELVRIKGQVTQYTQGNSETTSNYIVVGEYGNPIRVNTTAEKPEIMNSYLVIGTVVIDPYNQQPYIIERSKSSLNGDDSIMLYTILAAGFVLIGIILVLLLRKPKNEPVPQQEFAQSFQPHQQTNFDGFGGSQEQSADQFKTIKLASPDASDKTLKFIPGKLIITAGLDSGREFKISGYPTPEGNMVTIGREDVKGERSYSHIQLTEKTVSRKQAELIANNGSLFIKNLSETNLTQLDGRDLAPGEVKEIKDKSTIKTGEVEFQYYR